MKNGFRKALAQIRGSLTPNGISDAQLLKSFIAERDEAAFAALVRRHGPMVLGVCRRILRNAHDTDDAFQATFLVLVQKAAAVLNKQALASWLYTVAYRSALEARIRNTRRQNRERQMGMRHAEVPAAEPQDWRPVLDEELSRLPEKYRNPVILCDLESRPRRDAARQLGLAEGTLSSRLATARRMLAQRLSRRGVTLSGGALALAISEASAGLPPSLVGSTTRAAVGVAAGQLAAISTSVSTIMKGATQAMFVAKLKVLTTTVMVLVLGAGSLVYCASGQTGAPARPANEMEALRKENELLKVNLRVTLEKIQTLESEVGTLKNQVKAAATATKKGTFFEIANPVEFRFDTQYFRINEPWTDVEKAMKTHPAAMEEALKLLRAKDLPARQRAVEQMEKVLKKLREDIKRPAGN